MKSINKSLKKSPIRNKDLRINPIKETLRKTSENSDYFFKEHLIISSRKNSSCKNSTRKNSKESIKNIAKTSNFSPPKTNRYKNIFIGNKKESYARQYSGYSQKFDSVETCKNRSRKNENSNTNF